MHADLKSTKSGKIQQETPKKVHSWSNQFWNRVAKVSVKEQIEKFSNHNHDPQTKKLVHTKKKFIHRYNK